MSGWKDMHYAPRDGTQILVARDNDCGWDYYVVWWNGIEPYPWKAEHNAYPDGRFDYWKPIDEPYEIVCNGDWGGGFDK